MANDDADADDVCLATNDDADADDVCLRQMMTLTLMMFALRQMMTLTLMMFALWQMMTLMRLDMLPYGNEIFIITARKFKGGTASLVVLFKIKREDIILPYM
ncbi:MAG: hypothetical protein IJO74_00575 [Clostridia bacterium]|nr:hypothetical protein [Clostridia bacterium]